MSNDTNTTPAGGTPDTGEKTFSQEDVNRIVSERLSKEKTKIEADIVKREQALSQKELMLTAKEKAKEAGIPEDVLSVLNFTDASTLDAAITTIKKSIQPPATETNNPPAVAGGAGFGNGRPPGAGDEYRQAMGLR